jgi:hypothetical protein
MSTDYDAGLAVGWLLTIEDLKSVFGRSIPEESHMEDRWDPKTGVGPTQIRIVDREQGWYLQLPNDEELFNQGFDPASSEGDVLGFLEKLCTQARCEFALSEPGERLVRDRVPVQGSGGSAADGSKGHIKAGGANRPTAQKAGPVTKRRGPEAACPALPQLNWGFK